jgi:hypothetical protein
MAVLKRGSDSRKRLTPGPVGDEIEEKKEQRQNHPNGIGYSDNTQESAKIKEPGQEELEGGPLYALEKYSNIPSIYHIFKENLVPIVFKPVPIKFYFEETFVYHITYRKFLNPA